MLTTRTAHTDFEARQAAGRAARVLTPRSTHGAWEPAIDRPDPVALLDEQGADRVPELVPIRYGRMMVSPLTFYRGTALIMAADLATTPDSGIHTQLCGDAHLSNFGLFASPERHLVFDINDFDETLPGPWEWDLKRLVTSFEVAGRQRGFKHSDRRAATLAATRAYRKQMNRAADQGVLAAWYDRTSIDEALAGVERAKRSAGVSAKQIRRATDVVAKARTKDSLAAVAKLTGMVDGRLRILAAPPLVEPIEDLLPDEHEREQMERAMTGMLTSYRATLVDERHPIEEYRYLHMARKVVGVGSVGTRAWIVLLQGRDEHDLLLLQAKEAQPSVLERFVGASAYGQHGERVVAGQRVMQSSSDIFLGWQTVEGLDGESRDFYIRQLHDWKGSVDADTLRPSGALFYARLCGATLARAHARSGDRVAIAAYLGRGSRFDEAIAEFAESYADQNERDYAAFVQAVASGRLTARQGL